MGIKKAGAGIGLAGHYERRRQGMLTTDKSLLNGRYQKEDGMKKRKGCFLRKSPEKREQTITDPATAGVTVRFFIHEIAFVSSSGL